MIWKTREQRRCQRGSIWTRCDTLETTSTLGRSIRLRGSGLITGRRTCRLKWLRTGGMRIPCMAASLVAETTGALGRGRDLTVLVVAESHPLVPCNKWAHRSCQLWWDRIMEQNQNLLVGFKEGARWRDWRQLVHRLWNNHSIRWWMLFLAINYRVTGKI